MRDSIMSMPLRRAVDGLLIAESLSRLLLFLLNSGRLLVPRLLVESCFVVVVIDRTFNPTLRFLSVLDISHALSDGERNDTNV